MKYFSVTGMALAAALGVAGMAQAEVIYDNGGPTDLGNEATHWVQAEDFTLDEDANVTGAGIYIGGAGGIGKWDGSVNYWIFSDSGGPGNILASGAGQNVATTDTGIGWINGGNIYRLEFDFETDFAAEAGVTYWLGIHLAEDFDSVDLIYWVLTDDNDTAKSRYNHLGTFDSWTVSNYEHAFFLNGIRETGDPVDTPAPAGLTLLGAGLAALGAVRRRKA